MYITRKNVIFAKNIVEMIQSMTGFGKAVAEIAHKKVTVEIKSLNSKQLDLSMRIAPLYRDREMDFRALVTGALMRGKVEFSLTVEEISNQETPKLDPDVIADYFNQLQEVASRVGINSLPPYILPALLRLPESVHMVAPVVEEEELDRVCDVVNEALNNLLSFRKQEGEMLYRVFENKVNNISSLLASVEPFEKDRITLIRQRILDQLKDLPVSYDANRLEQELIYYIEKLDVNEEKHRLANHLQYFIETMNSEIPGQGKKLGFIAQEMGREINTLGSKSNHVQMQHIVVQMKDELEQIKEQVLNVL